MKAPAPLRNYQQMTRIVRKDGHARDGAGDYQLAQAYGDSDSVVDTRQRSLEELGMQPRSSRQPESPGLNNFLPNRQNTTLFHQLDQTQQRYFTGTPPATAAARQDAASGTKSRGFLGGDIDARSVNVQPPVTSQPAAETGRPSTAPVSPANPAVQHQANEQDYHHTEPPAGRRIRRMIRSVSMDGLAGSSLDINLK
ncbi:hypothetical protein [Oceanobacter mangrovi]|uniref:hypothetical protein n=1 Tax=Oceanobacter mangrovi TaxID=2862510 RepID=UPI001C8E2226|nr:hypothetical protein [Oceanobacter mangrovi]